MSRLTTSIILSILLFSLVPLSPANAQAYYYRYASVSSVNCTLTQIQFTRTSEWSFPAAGGEVHWAWYVNGAPDSNGVDIHSSGAGSSTNVATRAHVTAPAAFPYTVQVVLDTVIDSQTVYRSETTFTCPSAGTGSAVVSNPPSGSSVSQTSETDPLPGPDMVAMPEGAVVGTFVTTTPLYWDDSMDAASDIVMEAGQSLWVYGLNEAGTFYKVLLSGTTHWVPVANIGPTFDGVWSGAPLPTAVVD